jgi:hypothetical protein
MLSVTRRSEADGEPWQSKREPLHASPPEASSPLADHPVGFIQALFSGSDSRIAPDPHTGLNKYLCPTVPTPGLACASSCTASPVSAQGFDRAAEAFSDIVLAPSPRQRVDRLGALTDQIEARLLRYFGVDGLAQAFLCPSGTDALLTTTLLVAEERRGAIRTAPQRGAILAAPRPGAILAAPRRGEAMTAILPSASETGTGVPMAAMGCVFDGPDRGTPLTDCVGKVVEIPLRSADGSPRGEDEVNDAFAAAAASASGHVIVYLTHSTKTGLIAPTSPPSGADVIVDACQARIEPQAVAAYLRHGWPVVVTGSKFFGGPAFSGAILFPRARLRANGGLPPVLPEAARLGTALRWTAALAMVDAFEPLAAGMTDILSHRGAAIERALASNPALVPVGGLQPRSSGWPASIFTFGVRDPQDQRRLLSAAELRPFYEHLAARAVLLGQPVNLGPFGGLRIAIGARDLLDGHGDGGPGTGYSGTGYSGDGGLAGIFAVLEEATTPSYRLGSVAGIA